MSIVRRYYGSQPIGEVINSRPAIKPKPRINFTVTPVGSVVTFATTSASYSWDDKLPYMYHHAVNTVLTFTAHLIDTTPVFNIVEWYWDFGNGATAVGNVATHTFKILNPNALVHLRATDDLGVISYASMNMMLVGP